MINYTDRFYKVYNKISWTDKLKKDRQNFYKNMSSFLKTENKTLLLFGRVQSGKTNTFLGYVAYEFDANNSNFAFVFAGTKKILMAQTVGIAEQIFTPFNTYKEGLKFDKKRTKLQDTKIFSEIVEKLRRGEKIVMCCLKHYVWIENAASIFHELIKLGLIKKTIIIDDESDEASLDNLDFKKNCDISSATYRAWMQFYKLDNSFNFISITATPFANLLAYKEDFLMKPSRCMVLPKNEDYYDYEDIVQNDKVFTVYEDTNGGKLTFEIKKAVIEFLLTSDFAKRQIDIQYTEMVLMPSFKIKDHFALKEELDVYFNSFSIDSIETTQIFEWLAEKYNIDIEAIADIVYSKITMNKQKTICHNTYSKVDEELQKIRGSNNCIIHIGFRKISRGVDFSNLISFFSYYQKSYPYMFDSTFQMGRFFGYRKKTIEYFNIYLSASLCDVFKIIFSASERLINKMEKYGKTDDLSVISENIEFEWEQITSNIGVLATRLTAVKQEVLYNDETIFQRKIYGDKFNFINEKIDFLADGNFYYDNNNLLNKIYNVLKDNINFNSSTLGEEFGSFDCVKFENIESMCSLLKHFNIDIIQTIYSIYFDEDQIALKALLGNKKPFIVSLMELKDKALRKWKFDENKQRFSSAKIGKTDSYIGDNYWAKNTDYNFIQLYQLDVPNSGYIGNFRKHDSQIIILMRLTSFNDFMENEQESSIVSIRNNNGE